MVKFPFLYFSFVDYIMMSILTYICYYFKFEDLILKYIDFFRLRECVELLKYMETKGLLDMTKVHASIWLLLGVLFFNFEFLLHAIFTGHRCIMQSFSTLARDKRQLKRLLITLGLFQIQP